MGNILELVGEDGSVLPHTMSTGQVRFSNHFDSFYNADAAKKLIRYLQHPEVQAEINDRKKMEEHYRDFYGFGEYSLSDIFTFGKDGGIAAALGKPEYLLGNLNPIYPEVRKHWLSMIRFCLERGVDGINLRVGNHSKMTDYWEYGFNQPVLEKTNGKTDCLSIGKVNGDAYTQFLREAHELIKSYGKRLTLHLETAMVMPEDRPGKLNSLPPNFDWQWETWVKEIGDEFEIRGIYELRPWNFEKVIEIFGAATQAAGKPLYLQGDFHGMAFDGPFFSTEAEINLVNHHELLDGYVFYETANVTRLNNDGHIEGSEVIGNILKNLKLKN